MKCFYQLYFRKDFLPNIVFKIKIYEDSVVGRIFYGCFKFLQNDFRKRER